MFPVTLKTSFNHPAKHWMCQSVNVINQTVHLIREDNEDNNNNEKALRETQTLRARRSPPIDAQSPRWL